MLVPEGLCCGLSVPGEVELELVVGQERVRVQGQAVQRERRGVAVKLGREALDEACRLLPGPDRCSTTPVRSVQLGRLGGADRHTGPFLERIRPGALEYHEDLLWLDEVPATACAEGGPDSGRAPQEDASQPAILELWADSEAEWDEAGATGGPMLPTVGAHPAGPRETEMEEMDPDRGDADVLQRAAEPAPPADPLSCSESVVEGAGAEPAEADPGACNGAACLPADLGQEDLLRLAADPETGSRPEQVLAILRHPAVSRALAVRLVQRLGPAELVEAAEDRSLPLAVRKTARRRLECPRRL